MNIAPSLLLQAATAAAGHQQYPPGTLYVVATPIGNLADLTLRSVYVLTRVDAVVCEDKRVTAQLLHHLGLHKPLLALHAHNEYEAAAAVLARLAACESVAYVSDAGTPAVSDPGAVLVAQAAAAGHKVVPLPGASSALAALSVAGDTAATGFRFVGFLPSKGGERRSALAAALADAGAQVLFEAPHRITALAAELAAAAPARRVTLARELTKQFETIVTLAAADLPAWLAADDHRQRGEFVLVLHAVPTLRAASNALPPATLQTLRVLLRELPLKQAVALAADITGAPRNALYESALAERGRTPPEGPPRGRQAADPPKAGQTAVGDGVAADAGSGADPGAGLDAGPGAGPGAGLGTGSGAVQGADSEAESFSAVPERRVRTPPI